MMETELKFEAVLHGNAIKQFKAKSMTTIYRQYNKYCKSKGYNISQRATNSFGYIAWTNGKDVIALRRSTKGVL